MNDDRWNRVKAVFHEAVGCPTQNRPAFLNGACGADTELRAEVESLLSSHDDVDSVMASPTHPLVDETTPTAANEPPGTVIGRYKLLELIGEGGFGAVYMAEQREPVRRKVALKIIKLGMDTKQTLARFEAERQALAMMEHANIARVLDAGATDAGRPYFVMELVKGVPVTEYCDTQELSTKARLGLFVDVCNAVQHAHQKGVIHRDIKPSNVMVTIADGKPVPKVIDFGIAKATNRELTDKTFFTEFRQLIGTPAYMSPEQAEMSGVDIDTRSDIYSLGVLLYELLTGTTPFDPQRLRSAAFGEMQRIIREEDPDKPSTRVSSLQSEPRTQVRGPSEPEAQAEGSSPTATPASARASGSDAHGSDAQGSSAFAFPVPRSPIPDPSSAFNIAKHRQTDPARLARELRGDLDWIVMKCLEKDRTRRYDTANGLALDLQRHLKNEPVLAGPPSQAYRLRKFVARNRGPVAAGVAIAIVLVLGTIGTSTGLVWALREADRAERQWQLAEERANETRQVSDFQARMLSQIDSNEAGVKLLGDIRTRFDEALAESGVPQAERAARLAAFASELARVNATDTAAEMIDRTILQPALAAIEEEFTNQPVVDAALRHTLADLYHRIGKYDEAWPLLDRALATRRRLLGEEHPDTLASIHLMGTLLLSQGRYEQAEPFIRKALEKRRRLVGDDDAGTLQSITNMGNLLFSQGKLEEAEPYHREALDKRRRLLGEEHADTLQSINNMGMLLFEKGELDQAEPHLRELLEKSRRVLGDDHMHTLAAINNLGGLLRAQGKFEEAEPYLREALKKCRSVLGDEHPRSLSAMNSLGGLFYYWGKLDQAEPYWREALTKRRRVLGEQHPDTLISVSNLGGLLQAQGKLEQAEPYLREALEKFRRVLGEDHPNTLVLTANVGSLLRDQGKYEQAEPYHIEALRKFRRLMGEDHPNTLSLILNMGTLLSAQDKFEQAEPYFREAMEKCRRVLGQEHPTTLKSIDGLGLVLRKQGKLEQAEPYHHEALEKYRRVLGEENPDTLISTANMVSLLLGQGDFTAAEALLVPAAAIAETKLPPRHRVRGLMVRAFVELYDAWDEAEPGQGYDAKAAEWRARLEAFRQPESGPDDDG